MVRVRVNAHGEDATAGSNLSMREPPPVYTNRLQCEECNRVSREGERGWTARLTYG